MDYDADRTNSYRVAVTPTIPEDGRASDGTAKSRRRRPPSKGSRSTVADEVDDLRATFEMDEHKISLDALYARYATDPNMGLTALRVKEVYEVFGPNRRTPVPTVPDWVLFCKNVFGGFSLLLWIACVLCLVTFSVQSDLMDRPPYENLALAIILAIVVILTGLFSYVQEKRGIRLLERFCRKTPQSVNVVREGKKMVLDSEELVMGDVVDIKAGDKIPADIRIISSHNFKVDNSLINGVLEPQLRSPEFTHEDPLETINMAYSSANAVEGSCRGVVVATGDRVLVARLLTSVEFHYPESSLIREVTCTMQTLTSVGIIVGMVLFIVAYLTRPLWFGFQWFDALVILVGIILAIVPEGLLAVVSLSLILTANRLYSKNLMAKNLDSIETLGRVSSILVDKRRALTSGVLKVSHLWFNGNRVDADLSEDNGESYRRTQTFQSLLRIASLCNTALFATEQGDVTPSKRKASGDQYDVALLKWVDSQEGNAEQSSSRNPKVCEIPFNPNNRFHVTIHEVPDQKDHSYVLLMKGAPEHLLDACSTIMFNGKEVALDGKLKEALSEAFIEFGSLGETVLGFCDYKLPKQKFSSGYPFDADDQNFPLMGLRFVGLISFADSLRPNVPDAVGKCRTAGIRAVMVTGDHPITAKALARQCRIFIEDSKTVEDIATERGIGISDVSSKEANAVVIHGSDLKDMTHDRLDYLLRTHRDVIFARCTIQQKLYIVEGLQALGGIVASTGVSVCDAPVLRKAHLGIALNVAGDDVAKSAGDLILLDDNFATIVAGVEEGRLIFENLRKSVAYLITSNMPEVWPFFLFLLLGIPLPLGALTILVIDLGTDMLPAISLTYERPEYDIMTVNPRNPQETRLIDFNVIDVRNGQIGIIEMAAGFFSYIVVMGENGFWMENLLYRRRAWDSVGVSDMRDSYGQEWTYERRKYLEWTCHSAFFISVVICQWMNLLCCKARNKLIHQQGCRNHVLTFAFIFEAILAILLLYIPGMDVAFRLMPIKINWWFCSLPFALLILMYDEARIFLKVKFRHKFNFHN
ncbi:hypothetical protein CHUAL_007100 [Chamberlinius hualienensis]